MSDIDPTLKPTPPEDQKPSPAELVDKKFTEIYQIHMDHPERSYVRASSEAEVARLSSVDGQTIDLIRPALDRLPSSELNFQIQIYEKAINLTTGETSTDQVMREYLMQGHNVFGEVILGRDGQQYFVELPQEKAEELASKVAEANLIPWKEPS